MPKFRIFKDASWGYRDIEAPDLETAAKLGLESAHKPDEWKVTEPELETRLIGGMELNANNAGELRSIPREGFRFDYQPNGTVLLRDTVHGRTTELVPKYTLVTLTEEDLKKRS